MSETAKSPVILFAKGSLSSTAKANLRKAGYTVVEATDTSKIHQFYPENFNAASDRAKINAFEHALAKTVPIYQSDLGAYYIHYLKQEKAF